MEKKNSDWISNLRAISTIAVVVLHASSLYAGNYNVNPNNPWWWITGNIFDGFVRFCVPVFIMISGFLWLSGSESAAVFYKKRSLRLIGPFVFWSFITYLYTIYYADPTSSHMDIMRNFYSQFRGGQLSFHFWYIYMLIGLFLITPVFRGWIKNADKKDVRLFLIVWLTVIIYENTIFDSVRIGIDLQMFSGYIGYLVLGYYLVYHVHLSPEKEKNAGRFLFFLGSTITILGTYFVSKAMKDFYVKFYEYLTVNVIMASVGIFLWFKNVVLKNNFIINVRNSIGKYGYGIYLCHVMVLGVFMKNQPWTNYSPCIYIPTVALLTFLISWLIIYLLNRIPFAKYFVG